jgi:hypothetical protein
MAISFRVAGAVVTAASGGITLTAPAGTLSTDVVLAGFHYRGGTGVTIAPPAGWTLVKRLDTGTVAGSAVYWALGSVASYAFTLSGNAKTVGFTLGYIGVDNTTPMDAIATSQTNASSTTGTAPSITTVTDTAWQVCWFQFDVSATFTDTSPLVHRQSGALGGGAASTQVSEDAGDFIVTPAGISGAKTTTASSAAANTGFSVALRPAPAVPIHVRADLVILQAVNRGVR